MENSAICVSVLTYRVIKSAFFPLTEAPLHMSHLFNSTTLKSLGLLPANAAPEEYIFFTQRTNY